LTAWEDNKQYRQTDSELVARGQPNTAFQVTYNWQEKKGLLISHNGTPRKHGICQTVVYITIDRARHSGTQLLIRELLPTRYCRTKDPSNKGLV